MFSRQQQMFPQPGKLFHKTIWFKSNQFSSQLFGKTTDLYVLFRIEFPNKNFLWVLCLENPPYFFAPVSSTKTEDQIEVCESSSQLIRAGLIQCHRDALTTLPSCNDFRVFQGSLLGHRAGKKDKTKGTWKQSHFFKMNLRTLSYIYTYIYLWQYFCRNTPVNMNLLILKRSGLDLIMLWL